MSWYHNAPVQIMASMGILGLAAYIYQLVTRVLTLFKKLDEYMPVYTLSFIGLLMVSMIEPGEFSPIPFGLITVFSFLLLDSPEAKERITFPKFRLLLFRISKEEPRFFF